MFITTPEALADLTFDGALPCVAYARLLLDSAHLQALRSGNTDLAGDLVQVYALLVDLCDKHDIVSDT